MKETVTYLDRLREIAIDQYGFVTAAQALAAEVPSTELSKMVARKRLEHVSYGVYRVPLVPYTEYTRFMQALLWTGVPEAVLSHDTALDIYEVSDMNPTAIHITVPKSKRVRKSGGEGYIIHYQDLEANNISWFEGMRIVTLIEAVEQCIKNCVPRYLIRQALERGSKNDRELAAEKGRLTKLLEERDAAR